METAKILYKLDKICDRLIENEELLTELDRRIGDGDHGINVKRGFSEIKKALPTYKGKTVKEIFNGIAIILMSKVGGSSGPLFSTAFMKAGKEESFGGMLSAAAEGIEFRGKAVVGDKTMVDVLRPAAVTYNEAISEGNTHQEAMAKTVAVAKEKLDYTETIAAKKGRASYLGERSIGTKDPGAYSIYLILDEIGRDDS